MELSIFQNITQQILYFWDIVHHSTFMTGYDVVKVQTCSHTKFDIEVY